MKSRYYFYLTICLSFFILFSACSRKCSGPPKVLVFSKTAGFHHVSIPDGIKAIQKLGKENGFVVDTTTNASWFTEDTLKKYATVIFMSTSGNFLNHYQQADFERYIQAGGGYVGIHGAAAGEYHWPWYGKLVGAFFKNHPQQQQANLEIHKDAKLPITDSLPSPWIRYDEWYNFRTLPKGVNVLVSIDEKSYKGGENGDYHPMVWYHEFDGGRAFYIGLGHTKESYLEPGFLQLLLEGIQYTIDQNKSLDYSKTTSLRVPDEDRFAKKTLAGNLDEPTEITILPNTDILLAERKGAIKFYDHAKQTMKQIAHMDVYHEALTPEGSTECGLLGLQVGPNFEKDHWVYVYYSPTGNESVDRLSRFKFQNEKFDLESEQIILDVPTDREICCHTGGSVALDAEGNLLVSTGDNTTPFVQRDPKTGKPYPFNTNGFAPLDDRPGYEHYDDRRSAGSSNDLRGKIIRIHVNEDGSYSIPEGNLFPKGTSKARPEIYVMGNRNPYRISIDKHTGFLYWGEVGNDAREDSLKTRGPRGYDEINQARGAGNFGWPYFVGDNYAYHEYDYATGKSGPAFDPNNPVNTSRNNTGLKNLPPAQPAFIWYPYAVSPDFSILGSGGRTAMAGPVYYVDDYPKETRYPDYYNKKLFIYDFIRNWIMAVTMNEKGDLQTIEPFMSNTRFRNIIDMEAGSDGRIYIVEYGEGWFTKNPEAALSVITYNGGNRSPVAQIKVDQTAGTLPLQIEASASGSIDPDGDHLTYSWDFGDGHTEKTEQLTVNHTYKQAGVYPVSVTLSDQKGGITKSSSIRVYAGNSLPDIKIQVKGNPSFYFPNKPVNYKVEVTDQEDRTIDPSGVIVQARYLKSRDQAVLASRLGIGAMLSGKHLMESLDCKSCHKVDKKSVGPSFKQVAGRYKDQSNAISFLSEKIISGGSGNWGEIAMAAHPELSVSNANTIVNWILSLSDDNGVKNKPLPAKGTFIPSKKFSLKDTGAIILSATYTDKGASGVPPLTGFQNIILYSPVLVGSKARTSSKVTNFKYQDKNLKLISGDNDWILFSNVHLQDVSKIDIQYCTKGLSKDGWNMEVRMDNPKDGKLLGQTILGANVKAMQLVNETVAVASASKNKKMDLYLVFRKKEGNEDNAIAVNKIQLE